MQINIPDADSFRSIKKYKKLFNNIFNWNLKNIKDFYDNLPYGWQYIRDT
jgi:hypothetical protein